MLAECERIRARDGGPSANWYEARLAARNAVHTAAPELIQALKDIGGECVAALGTEEHVLASRIKDILTALARKLDRAEGAA